jgi:hypothetical protein
LLLLVLSLMATIKTVFAVCSMHTIKVTCAPTSYEHRSRLHLLCCVTCSSLIIRPPNSRHDDTASIESYICAATPPACYKRLQPVTNEPQRSHRAGSTLLLLQQLLLPNAACQHHHLGCYAAGAATAASPASSTARAVLLQPIAACCC